MTLPSREAVIEVVEDLRAVLFPGYFGTNDLHDESLHYFVGATLARAMRSLEEQVRRGIAFTERHDLDACEHCFDAAQGATRGFLSQVPAIRRLVASDVEAAYEGDPALKSRDEAIFAYPGIFAVTNQRIAHELHVLGVPLIPRIITEHAHTLTGIDIHPGARIGERLFIDHGTGVVVGRDEPASATGSASTRASRSARRASRSTSTGKPIKGIDRHPIVEDDVVIYAGATILGRDHHRQGLVHRRQRLAHPERAPGQPHHAGRGPRAALLARRRHLASPPPPRREGSTTWPTHPWHDVELPRYVEEPIPAIIEIPTGSKVGDSSMMAGIPWLLEKRGSSTSCHGACRPSMTPSPRGAATLYAAAVGITLLGTSAWVMRLPGGTLRVPRLAPDGRALPHGDAAEDGGAGVYHDVVLDDWVAVDALIGLPWSSTGKLFAPSGRPGNADPVADPAVSPTTTPVPWSIKSPRRCTMPVTRDDQE